MAYVFDEIFIFLWVILYTHWKPWKLRSAYDAGNMNDTLDFRAASK